MAFKPSQLDMIGKYESVCMEKQQDLLKRYVFFRKLDLRQDTTLLFTAVVMADGRLRGSTLF